MTPATLHTALSSLWEEDKVDLFMSGNLQLESPAEAILKVFEKSRKTAVTAPKNEAIPDFAYTDFGTPGKVVEQKHIDDLDITQVQFENGATLYLKKTDFAADQIRIGVRFGRGKLTAPVDLPGLATLGNRTFSLGALGKHSHEDLRRILAGRNANVGFSVGDEAFTLSGNTTPADVELTFQLMAAYMQDPGYRREALDIMQRGLDRTYVRLKSTPEGVVQDQVSRFLAGGDVRFGFPLREDLDKRDLTQLEKWLKPALQADSMHIGVVGDFDPEMIIRAVGATLGALPARSKTIEHAADRRKLDFPPVADTHTFKYTSEIEKAVAAVCWPTDDIWDISRTRRLGVLADIFDDRLRIRIREEQGDTYSPYAYSRCSPVYTGFGYLMGGNHGGSR